MINSFNLEAGKLLFNYIQNHPLDLTSIHQISHKLAQNLESFEEFEVSKSHSHYFLVKSKHIQAKKLQKLLWDHAKIWIDDLEGFRDVDAHQFKIYTLSPEKNELLIEVLNTLVKEMP